MGGRYCYLCGKIDNKNTSVHKFPQKQEVFLQWLQACKLDEKDNVSTLKICSNHFRDEDFINKNAKKFGGRLTLKSTAVPRSKRSKQSKNSITHETQPYIEQQESLSSFILSRLPSVPLPTNINIAYQYICQEQENTESKYVPQPSTQLQTCQEITQQKTSNDSVCIELRYPEEQENSEYKNVLQLSTQLHTCQEISQADTPNCSRYVEARYSVKQENLESENVPQLPTCQEISQPNALKRSRYVEPRYPGDIEHCDISSPRQSRIAINLLKEVLNKKNVQVRRLQMQNRRLQARVQKLEHLIPKKQNRLPKEASNNILEMQPLHIRKMLSRKLNSRTKYSPELKSFALKLNSYSGRAYNYVRKTLGNLLPHQSTLRKW